MRIELIYDAHCPNVPAARLALARALRDAGIDTRWTEWNRAAPDGPDYARRYGSPTILVDGADVAGETPAAQAGACRVYPDGTGRLRGAPPPELIRAALCAAPRTRRTDRGAWLPTAATLPAVGAVLVPKLACPLCIPIIGSALGAAGVGLFPLEPWLVGAAVALVTLTLLVLGRGARRAGRWGMWCLAASGALAMLAGKFAFDSAWLAGAGAVVFIFGAVLTNRVTRPGDCPACHASDAAQPVNRP